MKETFLYAYHSIMPMLLVMALGYFIRRIGPWDVTFFKRLNTLCFRIFLPSYLFISVYSIGDLRELNWVIILFLGVGIVVLALLTMLLVHFVIPKRDQRGVIVQASFRSNQAVIGLSLAESLGGTAAVVFSALATGILVPLYNVIGVIVLTLYSEKEGEKVTLRRLLRMIATNPLIIGALAGVLVVFLRNLLPTGADGLPVFTLQRSLPDLFAALTNISRIASPMMLFCLGAMLDFSATKALLPQLALGVSLRLVICPLLTITAAVLLRGPMHLTMTEFPAIISVCATPLAISSEVMVQEIGGDDQLACQIVVWTSAFSMFTIFAFVFVLRTLGLI